METLPVIQYIEKLNTDRDCSRDRARTPGRGPPAVAILRRPLAVAVLAAGVGRRAEAVVPRRLVGAALRVASGGLGCLGGVAAADRSVEHAPAEHG
jgi:hypothetical protein